MCIYDRRLFAHKSFKEDFIMQARRIRACNGGVGEVSSLAVMILTTYIASFLKLSPDLTSAA
ncbi:hypothetical protein KIN20_022870 [Parelaphostrongylus tenuis]|uniref:Uncharacterized protein n=1 Tax=Parelaphostrongylus tenuis TaxID=148309 RepID=A0AAD5QSL0_PARTN|nr:hypothetical protein KIN20_022870 [Parelaphostrongylus tenuis]